MRTYPIPGLSGQTRRATFSLAGARKLAAVAARPGEHVVIVNGEEGEPASVKDRWLLRTRPHLVLDGALRAARAAGAATVYLYGAVNVASSLLREFPAEVGSHLRRACPRCARTDFLATARPFAVSPDSITPACPARTEPAPAPSPAAAPATSEAAL